MELSQSVCCNELKKADVLDSNGEKIGNIADFTFSFDGTLHLSRFILAGPRWEEFLEAVKVRPDKDLVFDASLIKKMGEEVHLDTSVNSLKTTLDKGAIPDGDIRLSALEKLDIKDENGEWIGRAIDVDFDTDGSSWLIVGGSFVEEKLEAVGLKADVDIIVPSDTIESIGDTIKLKVSKDELGSTMVEELSKKAPQIEEHQAEMDAHRDVAKVRLFSQRPF